MLISLLTIPQRVSEIRRRRRLPPCHKLPAIPPSVQAPVAPTQRRSGTRLRRGAQATPWHVRCEPVAGRIAGKEDRRTGQCWEGIQPQPGKTTDAEEKNPWAGS